MNFKIDKNLNYGRHCIRSFIQHADKKEMIVDIGAGSGEDLLIAREIVPEAKLVALEGYIPNVENLEKKSLTVYTLNLEEQSFPFENESVDILIVNQVLEHVKEIFWIWHEISRVLRVGGSVIVGVPNLASLHNRVLLSIGRQPSSIQLFSAHIRGYTKDGFIKFVSEVSPDIYTLKSFKGSNFYPFPLFLAKPLASCLPSMAVGIFFHFEKMNAYTANSVIRYPVKHNLETNYFTGNESGWKDSLSK